MPHVRTSVRGPKMTFFECFFLALDTRRLAGLRPVFFGPRTLVRTWGTRPVPRPYQMVQRLTGAIGWPALQAKAR